METIQFVIPNISCNHCVHTIVAELSELVGVKSVNGDVTSKNIMVVFEPPTTKEAIQNILAEINYPAQN